MIDKDGTFRNSFGDGWDRVLSTHPIPFYYCIGELKNPNLLLSWLVVIFEIFWSINIYLKQNVWLIEVNIAGVLLFFVVLGFFGMLFHCFSMNTIDPRLAGCQNCCYGWGILDCFPASMEACFALVVIFIVMFAILGIAYGFLAATMGIQRIWQKHYHILTKRELTKVHFSPYRTVLVNKSSACYILTARVDQTVGVE